jgi:proliferating cell nuclear antigen
VAEYEIKLMDIDQETLGIPDTEYDAQVSMSSAEFTRLCRDLGALGESVRIEVNKEGVRFTSEGDSANGSVLMKPGGSVKSMGESSEKKPKVKKEEDEDAQMDDEASEDDGGANGDEENEENEENEEEGSSKKRKRPKGSSEKVRKGKSKKAKTGDDDDDESGGVKIAMNQQVNLTFSLKYLQNFAKSSSLCNRVSLSMSNDVPLLVSQRHNLRVTSNYRIGRIRLRTGNRTLLPGSQNW